jgi:hypothetical protein
VLEWVDENGVSGYCDNEDAGSVLTRNSVTIIVYSFTTLYFNYNS